MSDQTTINSEKYLKAFRRVETLIMEMADNGERDRFRTALRSACKKSPLVSRFETDLDQFARLRNAIVHQSRGDRALAEPIDVVVRELEHVANLLEKPPRIPDQCYSRIDVFQGKNDIASALTYMRRNDYSQVAIRLTDTKLLGLLSANTITRWLGGLAQAQSDAPLQTEIDIVMKELESADSLEVLPRDSESQLAIARFELMAGAGKNLEAILITENGKLSEDPIGIVTVTDLPLLAKTFN